MVKLLSNSSHQMPYIVKVLIRIQYPMKQHVKFLIPNSHLTPNTLRTNFILMQFVVFGWDMQCFVFPERIRSPTGPRLSQELPGAQPGLHRNAIWGLMVGYLYKQNVLVVFRPISHHNLVRISLSFSAHDFLPVGRHTWRRGCGIIMSQLACHVDCCMCFDIKQLLPSKGHPVLLPRHGLCILRVFEELLLLPDPWPADNLAWTSKHEPAFPNARWAVVTKPWHWWSPLILRM